MFEKLPRGLVLKSETCTDGETFYTIILKNRFNLPWLHKTARLYKDWRDDSSSLELSDIIKYDFNNYTNCVKSEIFKLPNDKEMEILSEEIENLPYEERRKIYRKEKINLVNKIKMSPQGSFDPSYDSTIKKISNIDYDPEPLKKIFPRRKAYRRKLPINLTLLL